MNFHLKDGIYFRSEGNKVTIIKANSFEDAGTTLVETDVDAFCSIVASMSPHHELNNTFAYISDFIKNGVIFCGGCGAKMDHNTPGVGYLSIINMPSCKRCYETKFKPLFDWGMEQSGRSGLR